MKLSKVRRAFSFASAILFVYVLSPAAYPESTEFKLRAKCTYSLKRFMCHKENPTCVWNGTIMTNIENTFDLGTGGFLVFRHKDGDQLFQYQTDGDSAFFSFPFTKRGYDSRPDVTPMIGAKAFQINLKTGDFFTSSHTGFYGSKTTDSFLNMAQGSGSCEFSNLSKDRE